MKDLSKIKKDLEKVSPTICHAKWHYNQINMEQGRTANCHINPYHKIPQNARGLDFFNTPQKIKERQEMRSGKKPAGCSACWKAESHGVLCDRIWMSNNFVRRGFDNSTFDKDVVVPAYVGINLDNLCNFACSYCDNSQSSTWANLLRKNGPFKNINTDKARRYQSIMSRFKQTAEERKDMYQRLFDAIKENIKDIQDIEFEGGEPSNSPNFWKFINFLKTLDAKHLRISLASNLCPSNNYDLDKFKDLPKYFKQIKITGSVENIGKIAEFTRYGTRWHDIKPNIIKLMDLGIHLSFSATISALTVLNYDQFLEWQSQSGLKMYNHKTMVKEPEFQSIDVLPRHIRLKCSDKIANVLQKNKNYFDYHNTFEKLQSISDALRVPNKPDVRLQQDLKNFFIQYCDLTKNSHDILGKEFADWIHSVK